MQLYYDAYTVLRSEFLRK